MDIIIIIIIIILTVLATLFLSKRLQNNQSNEQPNKKSKQKITKYPPAEELPYKARPLLTKTEYAFYYYLKAICDKANLLICPKVRLEDIITVTAEDQASINKFRNYIKSRHLDFIICNDKLQTLCAIELDDPSHDTEKAKNVDEFKDNVCKKIGIKLFRVKTGTDYVQQIKQIILAIGTTNNSNNTTTTRNNK